MAYGGSYAHEEAVEVLGPFAKVTETPRVLHAGDVVRMNDFGAFADSVILGFDGEGLAKVSRPYVYASSVGTTGPVPLIGTETYELPVENIFKHFKIMENDGHRRT